MHEKSIGNSGWVYGHELGRNHLKDAFGSLIQTMSFENCSTEEEILNAFDTAKEERCGVIFTTAASLAPYALRFALETEDMQGLRRLLPLGEQAPEILDAALEEARARHLTEATALLLEKRRARPGAGRAKTWEL